MPTTAGKFALSVDLNPLISQISAAISVAQRACLRFPHVDDGNASVRLRHSEQSHSANVVRDGVPRPGLYLHHTHTRARTDTHTRCRRACGGQEDPQLLHLRMQIGRARLSPSTAAVPASARRRAATQHNHEPAEPRPEAGPCAGLPEDRRTTASQPQLLHLSTPNINNCIY